MLSIQQPGYFEWFSALISIKFSVKRRLKDSLIVLSPLLEPIRSSHNMAVFES